jgi:hypothetical protein
MRLYVASSWRNEERQQLAVETLREAGHEVYDFIHPPGGDHLGFSWSDVDPMWRRWRVHEYLDALHHPIAQAGFDSDFGAMQWAEACVLLLPCGRSAHLEAGYFVGAGKPLWIVLDDLEFPVPEGQSNPELMYKMATAILPGLEHLPGAIVDEQLMRLPF